MDIKIGTWLKSWHLTIIAVIFLVALFYFKVLVGFFQHDEWQTFAAAYLQNYRGVADVVGDSFLPKASHYAPLFSLTFNTLFSVFGVNYIGYAVVSLILHLFSIVLFFILAQYLTKKLIIAGMSSLLFGLNASSHQATAWIIANINTHGATIFGLLSLIIFSIFFMEGRKKHWLFFLSLALLIISLLFKEISVAFFGFLPLILLVYSKAKTRGPNVFFASIMIGVGILYFTVRLIMFSMPVSDSDYVVTKDQNINEIAYNTLTFPAKIFTQSIIPTWQLLGFSSTISSFLPNFITGQPGTSQFDQFVENVALQFIDFSIFIFAVLSVLFVLRSQTDRSLKRLLLLSLTFTILNSFIYALSPGRSGSIPVIDSRNIYLPAIGASFFIAIVIYIIGQRRVITAFLIFTLLIVLHMYWLNQQLELRVGTGVVRKAILQQIKKEHPTLPQKVVFFVESDTAYYGLAEKLPPFETGLGQALLVWYHSTEEFPAYFLENGFLRFITDQGYREDNGRGFGYFRDRKSLEEAIKKNNLSSNQVISYSYNGDSNTLQDTTAQTREKLKK